jgi:pyruvate,water dikinase
VVSDAGGLLSHTAICAREYGIPAVVATQVATTAIPEGATITVDGTSGRVTIED